MEKICNSIFLTFIHSHPAATSITFAAFVMINKKIMSWTEKQLKKLSACSAKDNKRYTQQIFVRIVLNDKLCHFLNFC